MKLSRYDSWGETGVYGPDLSYEMPGQFEGCDQVPSARRSQRVPTSNLSDSPSGLDVEIDLPQSEDPDEIATAPLKDATVTLPEGITVNPAGANGLAACTPAQISLGSDEPVGCPEASKIASVLVSTPVFATPIEGSVYLATQYDNPFASLLAGYLVLSDPGRGLLVKIPGKITVDPATGQLTGAFEDNPQLPFSELRLHFKAGAHAALTTPQTCGSYQASGELSPWSGTATVSGTSGFAIVKGPDGGPCPSDPAALPNRPSFDAGTRQPDRRELQPLRLAPAPRATAPSRSPPSHVKLPPGLTGKLAGTARVLRCGPGSRGGKDRRRRSRPAPPARLAPAWERSSPRRRSRPHPLLRPRRRLPRRPLQGRPALARR